MNTTRLSIQETKPNSLDSRPNNLPIQPTVLLGRKHELAAIQCLLRHETLRLLTLTGPGGTGKTRMALQVAADLCDDFGDGVFFVALAPIRDPALVVPTIVQALGLKDLGDRQPLASLQTYLGSKHLLLVLDNFEHVAPAASLLSELLETCPRLHLLVTSRELLHLRAEHQFPVLPLALPSFRDHQDPETLARYVAVELFVQRAQAVAPDFQLTPENARTIAEICVRLDGLPLAIELAAARINLLPPQALLNRLGRRLQVLTSKLRDVPERQQTLRKTLTWSYDLLTPEEQRLFRRLSIFVGGWSLEAAEEVCQDTNDNEIDILDAMTSLIEKSLVQKRMVIGGEPRLTLLETVREYGLERLEDSGDAVAVQRAHAAFFLALAEKAELELHGAQQAEWMERLEREHDNLRAILHWSLEMGEQECALRVVGALWWFWNIQGHASEGRRFLQQALVNCDDVAISVRAKALRTAGGLAYAQGDYAQAENLCSTSLAFFRELTATRYTAEVLWMLGQIAWARGNYASARERVEEARAILIATGDRQLLVLVLIMLARVDTAQGQYTSAHSLLEESLQISREVDDKFHFANALGHLAKVYFYSQGDAAKARLLYEEALGLYRVFGPTWTSAYTQSDLSQVVLYQGDRSLAGSLIEESLVHLREVGDRRDLARALIISADIPASQGNYAAAQALYTESLKLLIQVEDKQCIAFSMERLGQVVARQGAPTWAVQFWGAAEMLRETMGSPMPPVYQSAYEQTVAAVRTQLGEKVFISAWTQGRTMTPEQALAAGEKLSLPFSPALQPSRVPTFHSSPEGLTPREIDVLRLLAHGLTSVQIAEQLVIGVTTVNFHVRSIYSKLGVTSRAAATRSAIELHLM